MKSWMARLGRALALVAVALACSACLGAFVFGGASVVREQLDMYIGKPLMEVRSQGDLHLNRGLYDQEGIADEPSPLGSHNLERKFYLDSGWKCEVAFQYTGKPGTVVAWRFITPERVCVKILTQESPRVANHPPIDQTEVFRHWQDSWVGKSIFKYESVGAGVEPVPLQYGPPTKLPELVYKHGDCSWGVTWNRGNERIVSWRYLSEPSLCRMNALNGGWADWPLPSRAEVAKQESLCRGGDVFRKQAEELMEAGKYREIIDMSEDRVNNCRSDRWAFYLRCKALALGESAWSVESCHRPQAEPSPGSAKDKEQMKGQ
jgi:hypothetical protein